VAGLGTNNLGRKLDAAQSKEVVFAALDAGVTLFDTADSYGASEERLGELLAGVREQVVIATKFGSVPKDSDRGSWGSPGSRTYIERAVESSLRALRTEWIDLYQLHKPDPAVPISETLSALHDLVQAGKVRYLGCSNFASWQVADAEWVARSSGVTPFVSAQNEYNLLNRAAEAELIPALSHYGMGLLPYFPLASGILSGKYRRGEAVPAGSRLAALGWQDRLTSEVFDVVEGLEKFAAARSLSLLDVAIGAVAATPTVASVISGATSAAQVQANVAPIRWKPDTADLVELAGITGTPQVAYAPYT